MATPFTITISAVDKATAVVKKVNDSVSRMVRPFEDVGQSFKSLGHELGFERIGRNLGTIGREANVAARGVASIVAPLGAVTGIGSVAGIVALAASWANLGRAIDSSARGIGISTGQLQSFQGAAKLLGVDADTTAGSLEGLANTMQDAQWGRNQGALLMFNKLGIGLKKSASGGWDVVGQYKAIANAIAREADPQKQKLIAQAFGLEGMLPFLREGAVGIERYESMVKRLGYVMGDDAVKRGKEFSVSLAGLGISIDGVKRAVGDSLIPAIKPLVDQFSNWLALNQQLIATNIGEWAKGFATWIGKIDWRAVGQGIVDFGKGIGKIVEWLGGWQNAAIAVVGVMNAGLIAGVLSLGVTLGRGMLGMAAFVRLLFRWRAAATAAGAATDAAAAAAARAAAAGAGGAGAGAAGAASRGLGLWPWLTGVGAMLYSPSLNDGEDAEIAKIRMRQGLPPVEQMTPGQADRERANSDAWNMLQGVKKDLATSSMDFFRSKGWSDAAAAGIVGNGIAESGLRDRIVGDAGRAWGVFQWHPDRQREFEKWAGFKVTDIRADRQKQLEFAHYELTQGREQSAGAKLRAAPSARAAGEIASRWWLRPGVSQEARDREAAVRGSMADQLAAPTGPYTRQQQTPAAAPTAAAPGGTVKVEIEYMNAPEGTKTNVKTTGNVQANSRIGHSGVGRIG